MVKEYNASGKSLVIDSITELASSTPVISRNIKNVADAQYIKKNYNALLEKVNGLFEDNLLTPSEKIILASLFNSISSSYSALTSKAEDLCITNQNIYKNYDTAFSNLEDSISPVLAEMDKPSDISGIVPSLSTLFSDYYEKEKLLEIDLFKYTTGLLDGLDDRTKFSMSIISSSGIALNSQSGSTTLSVKLIKEMTDDVTNIYPATAFSWSRMESGWTREGETGKSLIITESDLQNGFGTFLCRFYYEYEAGLFYKENAFATVHKTVKGDRGERGLQGLQGETGEQGIPGIPGPSGTNGLNSYFHIKYAPVENPTAAQMTETPSEYIGTYTDNVQTDSQDPSKYSWYRFKGLQGDKGDKGIPGTNGTNGQTSYLHIAYANDSTGSTGFSVSNSTNKTWIGQYTDFTQADSNDPSRYKWTKIKGEQGATGPKGTQGVPGKDGQTPMTLGAAMSGNGILIRGFTTSGDFTSGTAWVMNEGQRISVNCPASSLPITEDHGIGYLAIVKSSGTSNWQTALIRPIAQSNGTTSSIQWADYNSGTAVSYSEFFIIGSFLPSKSIDLYAAGRKPSSVIHSQFMQILSNSEVSNATELNIWAKAMDIERVFQKVAMMETFVDKLFANDIVISLLGQIRQNYDIKGDLQDSTKPGFFLGRGQFKTNNGELGAVRIFGDSVFEGEIDSEILSTSRINKNAKTISAIAFPAISECYYKNNELRDFIKKRIKPGIYTLIDSGIYNGTPIQNIGWIRYEISLNGDQKSYVVSENGMNNKAVSLTIAGDTITGGNGQSNWRNLTPYSQFKGLQQNGKQVSGVFSIETDCYITFTEDSGKKIVITGNHGTVFANNTALSFVGLAVSDGSTTWSTTGKWFKAWDVSFVPIAVKSGVYVSNLLPKPKQDPKIIRSLGTGNNQFDEVWAERVYGAVVNPG